MDYAGHFQVRRVRSEGSIKWQGRLLFLSHALVGERVGLEETDDGIWLLYFGSYFLGRFHEHDRKIRG